MRWQQGRRSGRIQDMRGRGGGAFPGMPGRGGGMGLPIPIPLGRGMGGMLMLLVLGFILFSSIGPGLCGGVGGGGGPSSGPAMIPSGPAEGTPSPSDTQADFVSAVLASTEDTWPGVLGRHGVQYPPPTLVLFDGQVSSACGFQSAAVGPFYCPNDRKVYLDLSFFRDLSSPQFGAPGDFAQAYVIAHEVGHHVQTVLGISQQVDQRRASMSEAEANETSVRTELQADCFAGVWGHQAAQQGMLEPGDVEEGLRAAAAIGDDRLQRRGQGYVVPESFTHGSSAQRVQWFRRGLSSGDISACDTFTARQP